MKVVLVNHSDTLGGASVVSMRLLKALVALGIDARMLVMKRNTRNLRVEELLPAWRRKACFLREHLDIFLHNGFSRKNLFKVSIANCGMPIADHPWVKEADCVMLNWVNQGMLSLDEIAKIEAPVVWTMHDMWCMTGICHHAGSCDNYLQQCGNCQYLHRGKTNDAKGRHPHDLSNSTWQRKADLYAKKEIHFVAVSNWLAEKAANSSLLSGQQVSIIANAIPVDEFLLSASKPRQRYGLPADKKLIVMGAARLDDPIKGLDIAIEAINGIDRTDICVALFGALRDKNALASLQKPYVWLGEITDSQTLKDIYAHADVVLSSSHYETLPGTLVEGLASGCLAVAFDHGGQSDIIDHLSNGYLAQYPDASDLTKGLRWALDQKPDKEALRRSVSKRFTAEAIANKYIALINKIIDSH